MQRSFDFELLLTILRSNLSGSSDQVIAEESLKLRFDREEDTIKLKEPLLDRVTGAVSIIGQQNLSPSEAPANARDLFMVTEAIRSILTTSVDPQETPGCKRQAKKNKSRSGLSLIYLAD